VKFKLLNLLSNNIVSEFSIDDEFIALLNSAPHDIVEGALEKLTKHKQQIWNPSESLQMELADTAAIRDKILSRERLNYNQRLIRKIIITPTKIYYQGPQLELANRILRTYKDHADDFMRVAFADDDLGKINNGPNADMLFKRIQAIMDAGVIVAGRRFEFLHYSNSSMKTAGCWFICPFTEKGKKIDAEMICISIGDFSGISNPATLGARMAQCFSSTTVTGRLREFNVKNIDDIERNGHCFSDGVGLIGKNVAYNNCGELRKWVPHATPSAFQFRMGGAKGVLTLDKRIPKDEVHLRKSQRKFPSTHLAFEVCRTSFYSPGFLNHQYVILLETLGIKQEVFLKLRDEAIQQLDEALQKPDEAIKALTETSDETNEIAQALIRMIQAGFFEINEPYLVNLLKLFRAIQLRDMKRRAKVHIRKGCNLLGVMDETGELPENKLFLQYTNPSTNKKEIVTGPVLVTRSPCLHPGDVQVVECVNLESLRHLVDVVVFSQHGQRPLPNMLAGGDLDGDTFFVSWDQRLLPKKTHEPMTYATGATGHPDKAMLAKVKEHFVNFLQQDNLGKIDNAWKAWADLSDDGARDPKAIRLAELHSDAVDFAKKGVPARMDPESKPKQWPDFMEKPESKNTYRSRKAVGAIYRSISVELQLVKEFKPRPELVVAGYEQYLEDAILNKKAYDNQIIALMNQYNVNSEFELVSGYMFKLDEAGIKKRPQELKEQVMQAVSTIQGHYRKLFFDDNILADPMMKPFKENILNRNERSGLVNDRLPLSEKVRRKASAWYMAAYDDRITTKVSTAGVSPAAPLPVTAVSDLPTQLDPAELQAAERRRATMVDREAAEYQDIDWDMNGRFYSFPWILHDLLCNIYVTATSQRQGTAGTAEYRAGAGNTGYVAEAMTAAREPTEVYLRPPGSDVFFQRVAG
ncbi:RNA dependent RNA polymerase-domain-containing protein, partial [Fimicolochytrium jonesii]|uniref:RNA dependent RNA polymerase-domain-containing protein n=1 Tax=Fimicolochytrium jonesii TaxID=1396493 RepID=UPI0022FED28D